MIAHGALIFIAVANLIVWSMIIANALGWTWV